MGERLIVSGGDALREFRLPQMKLARRIALDGAGALCAGEGCLYAVCGHDMIWRLDSELLVPTGLFAGGPGMCSLLLSRDGERLYALCAEADSLLMLSAYSGTPMIVNRVGVNPCAMTMDEQGTRIAVAGGASGEVLVLCPKTLAVTGRLQTSGVVFGASFAGNAVCALSLDETLNSVLTVFSSGGRRCEYGLEGMPGTIVPVDGGAAAATHKGLWKLEMKTGRICRIARMPGRAAKFLSSGENIMMTDMWSESLLIQNRVCGRWRKAACCVCDAALL